MHILRRLLSGVAILLFPIFVAAKNSSDTIIDSLRQAMAHMPDDTGKLKVLNRIILEYNNIDPDAAISFLDQGVVLAQNLNNPVLLGRQYNFLGYQYMMKKADYPKALENFFHGLKIYEENHIESSEVGDVLYNIGTDYLNQNNPDKAQEYYLKAIPFNHEKGLAMVYNGLGTIYGNNHDYEKSHDYYAKAIAINEKIGNTKEIAFIFGNIGDNYQDQSNYAKALSYYHKALDLFELQEDVDGIGTNLGNIGKCLFAISMDSARTPQADSLISASKQQNLLKAKKFLVAGIEKSKEADDVSNVLNYLPVLSLVCEQTGDVPGALHSLKAYIALKDSVFSADKNQKIALLETQREHELNMRLESLKRARDRARNIGLACVFVLLVVIIGTIALSYRNQKKSNRLLAVEKQKSDNLLLNILPGDVAKELKEKGVTEARLHDNVSVLFTDFVGFTKLAAVLSPHELVAELHECFTAFDNIMLKYGIEKIKTIGDAYMAISGLPAPNADHARLLVEAAIEIRKYMYIRKQEFGDKTFEIRIGIHSGSVVAGVVGMKKFAYDTWGDTVNIAARMEQNSLPGKINISDTTFQIVRNTIQCTYRGEIEAKNKGNLKMYFVES